MSWRVKAGAISAGLAAAGMLLGPAAQAAAPAQLTGTHLHAALLPASYFPAGYKVEKIQNYSSGAKLEHGPAKVHLNTYSCQRWVVGNFPETGFGESATAGDIISKAGNRAYGQDVLQFATPAKAAAFYRQWYAFAVRCRTVTTTFDGKVWKFTTKFIAKKHVGRYAAFRARQGLAVGGGRAFLNDSTTVLAGTDVYQLDAAGWAVPTTPAVPAALLHLIARVQAAR
jgi:hypothetical protein